LYSVKQRVRSRVLRGAGVGQDYGKPGGQAAAKNMSADERSARENKPRWRQLPNGPLCAWRQSGSGRRRPASRRGLLLARQRCLTRPIDLADTLVTFQL